MLHGSKFVKKKNDGRKMLCRLNFLFRTMTDQERNKHEWEHSPTPTSPYSEASSPTPRHWAPTSPCHDDCYDAAQSPSYSPPGPKIQRNALPLSRKNRTQTASARLFWPSLQGYSVERSEPRLFWSHLRGAPRRKIALQKRRG